MERLARPLETSGRRYDAIVAGSGYGGGVAASRLARMGLSVCVLERGREILPGEFATRLTDFRNDVQVTGRNGRKGAATALYDVRLGDHMHVLVACGLGGGSLVNAGVALRPDPRVFADPAWPGEVSGDGTLEAGFERAALWLRPQTDPAVRDHAKYQALDAAARALGASAVACPVTVSFEDAVNAGGRLQAACTRCGDCCGGCNAGAKTTVADTYLADAAQCGAEIFTRAEVRSVAKGPGGLWNVHVSRLDGGDEPGDGLVFTAPVVVLAAGSLGSTEILLRSRERELAVSSRLGKGFSANGDTIAFGYGAAEPVNAVGVGHPPRIPGLTVGATVSGKAAFRDGGDLTQEVCVQEGVLPSAVAPLLPVLFLPGGRIAGAVQSLISGVYRGPFARLQTLFAVSHDSAGGCLELKDGRLRLSWPGAEDEPFLARVDAVLGDLVRRSGGSYVRNPLAGTFTGTQPVTAHPLGGCVMGRTAGEGAVNHKGQVFDASCGPDGCAVHEGLYVLDGAVIPRSLGVNPLFTITALAERAMVHAAADWGATFDASPGPAAKRADAPAVRDA